MEAVLTEKSKEIVELREELASSNRFNDYFRKLDMESAKEKEEFKAEIKRLQNQLVADEQASLVRSNSLCSACCCVDKLHQTQDHRTVCLIDGDGYIFLRSLVLLGQAGGRVAAAKLTESIREFVHSDHSQVYVYVFVHKQGLLNTFKKCGLEIVAKHFEDFIIGFNQSTERFAFVDVGGGKEAVDSKLRGRFSHRLYIPRLMD